MKVSLSTIRKFLNFDLPPVGELVEKINLQLGGVEEITDLAAKYKDVVVVRIVSSEKHPSADRLSVCLIDDSGAVPDVERTSEGHVQVVCGAPNARAGIFAAWLPPKTTVPSTHGEPTPFVLEAREIRGQKSNGMLAAADELALGSDHSGIIELTDADLRPDGSEKSLAPGQNFAKLFELDDVVIDIENKMFTHRPDLFGQLGVAREIAGISGQTFVDPDWYWKIPQFSTATTDIPLHVFNDAGDKVSRFMAVAIKDVTVRPSPFWLQVELIRLGAKPINNIVDATNYVMLLTGQPTHAYDYDKLRGTTLGVRMARPGESLALLNGKSYELDGDDIVIVDGEAAVGLGGVMGGSNSEVLAETKNIVLEVATFDMYAIRKTSMRHGLFTDAVTRFNKGQSSLQNDRVLAKLTELLSLTTGVEQHGDTIDLRQNEQLYNSQTISGSLVVEPEFINTRLGLKLTDEVITTLLRNVHFACESQEGNVALHITAPFWRTDIELPEDVVEEVGRLYGFAKLPHELPQRTISPAPQNEVFEMKRLIRGKLAAAGANEVLTYSFVHENVLSKAGQDPAQAFRLSNALSPGLQYYRLSLLPSLIEKVHPNIKTGHDEFALFEFGKAHRKGDTDDEGLPREYPRLALIYAAKKGEHTAYYSARRYADHIAPGLRYQPLVSFDAGEYPIFEQLAAPFEPSRSAVLVAGDRFVGIVGEFTASVRKAFKLPECTAGFEIFQSHLAKMKPAVYVPLSRFPEVTQDITLRVVTTRGAQDVMDVAMQALQANRPPQTTLNLQITGVYQAENSDTKNITLRLQIASYEKTLTDAEVVALTDAVAAAAAESLQAVRV